MQNYKLKLCGYYEIGNTMALSTGLIIESIKPETVAARVKARSKRWPHVFCRPLFRGKRSPKMPCLRNLW